ncbi:MAG: carbohydrate-binding family V/XII [Pseudomonadota bacterium]
MFQRTFRQARSAVCAFALCIYSLPASAIDWPQEVSAPEATIVVYQPQPETLSGNQLSSRAAISLEVDGQDEAIFGAMWFTARLDTDRDAGTVLVRDIKVTRVGWPDSTDAQEQRFTAVVESAMPETGLTLSLERLTASLNTAEVEQRSLEQIKSEPPDIVFSQELAVLLLFDGKPRFSPVEGSDYERALNTPFLVVKDTRSGKHWLGSGSQWFTARDPLGPWSVDSSPPRDLVEMVASASAEEGPSVNKVVVATKPTELIATEGKADWQSLPGGELLYVVNTETPWLRQLATGNMYVLLSGRWYRSKSEDGPWTSVPANELPASFQDIPPASDIGGLRSSIAGTEEAEDALLDAAIPQTTAIQRDEAKLSVEYDGEPKFERIEGTSVAYAVNTGAQVLKIDGRYYAVDQGVWFTSGSAQGPWEVADTIPDEEISKIPPSSPVYNTTYVKVYESTPEIVYVGYTPGYLWSFPYYGVPVYGTGWYYPPYWGRYYYPRPPTWGFHVGYNPWTGWNFGVSWSNGFFSFGASWGGGWGGAYRPWGCCGGWYGGGYRGPTIINTGDINIGNNVNIGNRADISRDLNVADRRGERNLYNRTENRARNADKTLAREELQRARPTTQRANDVFADRNGEVARRSGSDWEQRVDGKWQTDRAGDVRDRAQSVTPQQREQAASRIEQRPASQRPQIDRRELDRSYQARQRGMSREMRRPSGMQRPMRRR